jgi:hypothetical protein
MNFFENRYVQLTLLTLGLGFLFWAVFWLILRAFGIHNFPIFLQLAVAFLGSGLLVAKYLAGRVF